MKKKISIIDYGLGNLFSLQRAISCLGFQSKVTKDPKEIEKSDKLILPGVGAFETGMKNLENNNLIEPIKNFKATGKNLLGICLGMQLLLDSSEEGGHYNGLGFIPGRVLKFSSPNFGEKNFKIPQVGWNKIFNRDENLETSKSFLLKNIKSESYFYFVHSYYVNVKNKGDSLATTKYGKDEFSSIIERENFIGTQFHPELSSYEGLKLLNAFIEL